MDRISKIEISLIQIERAILLALDEFEYVSAITLAGAAEEILGKILEAEGKTSSHTAILTLLQLSHEQLNLQTLSKEEQKEITNGTRNHLKHFMGTEYIEANLKQQACNLIHRAISNYIMLCKEPTKIIWRWIAEEKGFPSYPMKET